jgi:(4S)-4-hydroxy-5-phosphonooxypentane-2,3-dione isomerase
MKPLVGMIGLWHTCPAVKPMALAMSNLVILVRFQVVRGPQDNFLAHVRKNTATSVANEPGCRRFAVLTDAGLRNEVALYEVYDRSGAFEAHQQTQHFADFRDATEAIVLSFAVEHIILEESDDVTSRAIRRTDFSKLPKAA